MAENDFYKGELPVNYEQKCPVVLVLDTSGSMNGEPINELQGGIRHFINDVKNDTVTSSRLEVAIVTFNSAVKVHSTFKMINEMSVPALTANGTTKLVDGVERAIQVLETRKNWYKQTGQKYYRPYVILITDGYPDNDQNIEGLQKTINEGVEDKHFNFWAFGVLGADMDLLKKISHSSWVPQKIKGVEFSKFFKWLSSSFNQVTKSRDGDNINLKPKNEESNPFQLEV